MNPYEYIKDRLRRLIEDEPVSPYVRCASGFHKYDINRWWTCPECHKHRFPKDVLNPNK